MTELQRISSEMTEIRKTFQEMRPNGGFNFIMVDPAWKLEHWSNKGTAKGAEAHYKCESPEWIKSLPISTLAAKDCLLWLWATNPMLPQAIETLTAWGFTFKTAGHWVKLTKHGKLAFGYGYIFRTAGEPYIIGTIGKPKTTRSVRSVIMGKVREHSRKPEEAFIEAEKLMPEARRIEVFSRNTRPGWANFGDQAQLFDHTEAETKS